MFSRAESLVHSPMHLLFKARALAQLGQLVNARETYQEIIHDQATSPSPTLTKAQDAAKSEDQALEPRLAKITIKVDGPGAANATVTMDGAAVPAALLGLSHPVDPGEHHFQASSGGAQGGAASVTLAEGGTSTVTLTLAPASAATGEVLPAPNGAANASASGASSSPAPSDTGASESNGSGLRTGAYVALGVGVVGLAVGTAFAFKSKGKYDDADGLCPSSPCTLTSAQATQRAQLRDDGASAKTVALVGFIAGGVGVATGVTLLIVSSGKSHGDHANVHAWVGLDSLGLAGSF